MEPLRRRVRLLLESRGLVLVSRLDELTDAIMQAVEEDRAALMAVAEKNENYEEAIERDRDKWRDRAENTLANIVIEDGDAKVRDILKLRMQVKALREACKMARADLMAWASHDSMDDRDAAQARYANTPAVLAIDAALASVGK